MRRRFLFVALVLSGAAGLAHVDVSSGLGIANATQEVTFAVGHGCEGADTFAIRTLIPDGVSSVRPMNSDQWRASVEKSSAGIVTAVKWQKPDDEIVDGDTHYYKMTVRLKLPNKPFTYVHFPTEQMCKGSDGGVLTSQWISVDGGPPEPAPAVALVPARKAGWNKFVMPVAVTELERFFSDAQIVWKGTAAFSANASVAALISAMPGVTNLTALQANDEVWVKY